jgi:hypothetical protein
VKWPERKPKPPSLRRPLGGQNDDDITVQPSAYVNGFYIRKPHDPEDEDREVNDPDEIYICDWPAMKATIDALQRERGGQV